MQSGLHDDAIFSKKPYLCTNLFNFNFMDSSFLSFAHVGQKTIEAALDSIIQSVISFGGKFLCALVVYWLGKKLINILHNAVKKFFSHKHYDPSVVSFLMSLIQIGLMVILIIAIINILGINATSLVALLASAGVAIGLALSGSLQNFAGGVMILLFKPYRVGDYIEAQGQAGTVKEIQIFNTVLTTSDNKTIIIPNGGLSTSVVMNYSNQTTRRVELIVGIAYGQDFDHAKRVISRIIIEDRRIHKEPEPFIALHNLNQSSVDIVIRVWTAREEYWNVYFDLNEKLYKSFAEENIDIPFPQMTVHLAKSTHD